jgi:PAS domain S-box-containing protein
VKESEKRYREHIENIGDVIYILDKKRRVKYVNKTLERLLGMSLDDLKQKELHDIVALEPPRTVHTAIGGQKGAERTGLFEVKFKDMQGAERIIEFQESLVREGKSIKEIHGMGRDITEKRKLESQVLQAQKMEAIVALAGGIAHNFNNILTGIMGYSEYLISEKKEDDLDYEALKTIHEGSIRASNLTKQLLDTARGEQFSLTKVNLNGVVEKLFPLISGTFDKSIELRTHLDKNLMIIQGDIGQLEQSLLNLCINARDAMPSGGTLIIETYNQRLDEHYVKTHLGIEEGKYVVLSITDTGIGMAPEVKDRIFEPFFTTKGKTGGTGMGLATVYGIIQNHGGQITVYTEMGKGTTFKLYFPVIEGARMETPRKMKIDDKKGKGTILIIDDERAVRELWRDFLKKKGYRIITAEDGQRGIDVFRDSRDEIDLVILDLVMPNMGGEEALKRLREIRPNIKVLVSSGYSENGQAKEILKQGVNGFIHKPVRLAEIAERVRDVLNI